MCIDRKKNERYKGYYIVCQARVMCAYNISFALEWKKYNKNIEHQIKFKKWKSITTDKIKRYESTVQVKNMS